MSQNLELIISNPVQQDFPASINFNYEELKTGIKNTLENYKNLAYTEDTMTEAKKDVATLRKFSKALNDKRIEVKKWWNRPVAEFEKQVKDLDALVQEPILLIDKQVKEFDQKRIDEKLAEAKAYFFEKAEAEKVQSFLSWSLVEQKDFSNLSKSLNQIKKDIDATVERVKSDWAVIEGMKSLYESDMKFFYLKDLNLQETIAYDQKLKDQAEKRAAYEAERKRKEAEKQAEVKSENETVQDLFIPKQPPKQEESMKEAEVEEIHSISFKVFGTVQELQALSAYMKSNQLRFEKI